MCMEPTWLKWDGSECYARETRHNECISFLSRWRVDKTSKLRVLVDTDTGDGSLSATAREFQVTMEPQPNESRVSLSQFSSCLQDAMPSYLQNVPFLCDIYTGVWISYAFENAVPGFWRRLLLAQQNRRWPNQWSLAFASAIQLPGNSSFQSNSHHERIVWKLQLD